MSKSALSCVYVASDVFDAHLTKICLEDSGIRVYVDGEALMGALGDIPLGAVTAPRLMVSSENKEQALKILAEN